MSLYPITDSWQGSSATWDNLAMQVDDKIVSQPLAKGTIGEITFDVTDYISDCIAGTTVDKGIMLACTTTYTGNSNGQISYIHSSESSSGTGPTLTVTYEGTSVVKESKQLNQNLIYGKGVLTLSEAISDRAVMSVYSLQGKLIQQRELIQNVKEVPLVLPAGMYVVNITTSDLHIQKRIAVK